MTINKVAMIRDVRNHYGLGLLEAKNLVCDMFEEAEAASDTIEAKIQVVIRSAKELEGMTADTSPYSILVAIEDAARRATWLLDHRDDDDMPDLRCGCLTCNGASESLSMPDPEGTTRLDMIRDRLLTPGVLEF